MRTFRLILTSLLIVPTSAVLATTSADAATACEALTRPVHQVVKPTSNQSLVTVSETEANTYRTTKGYSVDNGAIFAVSAARGTGLVAIRRMVHPRTGDIHTVKAGAVATWKAKGYRDQGTKFFALASAQGCGQPVYNYAKAGKNRQVFTTDARNELAAAGWSNKGIAYYAAPAPDAYNPDDEDPTSDGTFGIAVIPDTQIEVFGTVNRFVHRTQWLADNREALDLRFVGHTGDVVNWGWLDPNQYAMADAAADVLDAAGLPYAWAIGNHDTRAVGHDGVPGSRGYGGSAYVNNPECVERLSPAECKSWLLVRDTQEFNALFTAERYTSVAGAFEPGKVDNIYSTFEAEGKKFMMLTLELWPRTEAVDWAKSVVAAHPDTNVLIQTHSYLTGSGTIYTDNGAYGANTPKYVFDNLVKQYPNIKAVFSGHTGTYAQRTDTGVNGNKIVSYLANLSLPTANFVRLVDIDVRNGSITSKLYSPITNETLATTTTGGLSFVG